MEKENTLDGRKLDHKTLEEIRIRAVKLVEAGHSPEDVINSLGMHRSCIYKWIAVYREGGLDALRAKKLYGRPQKLSASQLRWIYKTIVGKNPLQLKFEFALWTRDMIREVIKRKYGINLSAVSVGRMLARLGFSCQKPLMRAYQQDDALVNTWFEKEFPKIRTEAKRCKADLYFADEAGVRSDFHSGKTWSLKGKTPIVKTTGARFGLNVVSGITPTGKMRFMVVEGSVNSDKFIEFLNRLIYNSKKKVFLIVDGHPTHRSKKVKKFLQKHEKKIKMFFLPPYSPELNPDELVWNNLKNKIGKTIITGPDFLKSKVISHMRKLQKSPQLIRNFFFEPNVSYVIA